MTKALLPVPKPVNKARAKRYGKEVERKVTKIYNAAGIPARKVPYSGADKSGAFEETDISAAWFLTEVKARDVSPLSCNAKSINLAHLDKAREEGRKYGKPALLVFVRKGTEDRVVVCDLKDFVGIVGKAMLALGEK